MDEELTPQKETATLTETEQKKETNFENLPKLEDLLKSDQEIKQAKELKGLKSVEQDTVLETKTFARKADEKKVFIKRRLKILTAVYVGVFTLIFGFVIFNAVTQAILAKDIKNNANTIQSEIVATQVLEGEIENNEETAPFDVTLNEPRDYDDNTRGLSFVDKLIILFRSLFG